ncbi:hypothetical protein EJB05_02282, partial [Eragrostis curvula]
LAKQTVTINTKHHTISQLTEHQQQQNASARATRLVQALRDLDELDRYTSAARENVELELMASQWGQLSDLPRIDELESYRNGGFGAVPACPAVVAGLEKRTFRAGGVDDGRRELGGCAICLEEKFDEGQELSVMPCSRAHAFHTQCIIVWLGQSNASNNCFTLTQPTHIHLPACQPALAFCYAEQLHQARLPNPARTMG